MKNTINENISKFIRENRHSKIVNELYEANEYRDRRKFIHIIGIIRKCIRIQEHIRCVSEEIKERREEVRELKDDLKQLRDGHIADHNLFDELKIEV